MTESIPHREDQRREWTLWVLMAGEMAGCTAQEALDRVQDSFVGPELTPSAREASQYFRVERFEDFLPTPEAWDALGERISSLVLDVELNREALDEHIQKASPRWRVDRMPVIDRSLLRIGVAELTLLDKPRPRATINGMIELAKRYGTDTTPKFVNGILDQVRRNLEIPFQ